MTQNQRVDEYIKSNGSITSLEAFKELGITRLSARIFDLKKQGYEFNRITELSRNRYGETTRFTRYLLVKD